MFLHIMINQNTKKIKCQKNYNFLFFIAFDVMLEYIVCNLYEICNNY
jgi:hypothetical protein